ncbi:MAG: helix-turn-helix domain-containing protein [Candidatus Pacebacteria bacterium]|nr:helix-turn-helix domain-containing protein [Candidatus Paceibacterota bacterium]
MNDQKGELKELVINLGLSEVESEVYLAALESGNATASQIAKIARLQRVTTYEVLKRLSNRGFVKVKVKHGTKVKYFLPIGLQEVKNKVKTKKNELETSLRGIDSLSSFFNQKLSIQKTKPEVLYFEGVEGVKTAIHDTLDQRPKEILSFSSDKWLDSVFSKNFLKEYWDRRVALRIATRGIIPNENKAISYFNKKKNESELRQVRSLPKDKFDFRNEIDVYDNNICIVSLEEGKEHAIIIRSESLAQSMRDVFEVLWMVSGVYY